MKQRQIPLKARAEPPRQLPPSHASSSFPVRGPRAVTCSSSGQPGPGCQKSPNHRVQQNARSTGAGEEWPGTPHVQGSTEIIYSAAAAGQPGGKGAPAAEEQLASLTWSWWLSDQLRQLSARDRMAWHGAGYAGKHPGGFGMSTVGRLYNLLGQFLPELCHPQHKVLPQELKRNSYRNPPLSFLICQVHSFLSLGQPELSGLEGMATILSTQKVLEWLEAHFPVNQGPWPRRRLETQY